MSDPTPRLNELLRAAEQGRRPEVQAALASFESAPLAPLLASAGELTRRGFGDVVTYSREVFIPPTQLCRDTTGRGACCASVTSLRLSSSGRASGWSSPC